MRLLLVLLAVCVGVGGAAWLLLREDGPPALPDLETGGSRPGLAPTTPIKGADTERPRIGVRGKGDAGLVADPEAGPWRARVLRISGAPGSRVTGKALLEAVSTHLYVRTRDQETLDALRKETFDMDPAHELPLSALEPLLRQAGYAFEVKEPLFVVHRLKPEERDRPR